VPDLRGEIAHCERHRKMHHPRIVRYVDLNPRNRTTSTVYAKQLYIGFNPSRR
jgi:hypothetical protein